MYFQSELISDCWEQKIASIASILPSGKEKAAPKVLIGFGLTAQKTLRLLEGSLSHRHQQNRKARRKKMKNFRYGSSLSNGLAGIRMTIWRRVAFGRIMNRSKRNSQSQGMKSFIGLVIRMLYLNEPEILHTRFWIPTVNMNVALRWVDCTPMDHNIWGVSHLYHW